MATYVFDTNIFTAILRKEAKVINHVANALLANAEILLCPVVYYEIYCGLLYRDAGKQLDFFLKYTSSFVWQEFTQGDWQSAAQLWAGLRFEGHNVADADLLIGVYAMRRNATLITDNEKHFIPLKIRVENWRQ